MLPMLNTFPRLTRVNLYVVLYESELLVLEDFSVFSHDFMTKNLSQIIFGPTHQIGKIVNVVFFSSTAIYLEEIHVTVIKENHSLIRCRLIAHKNLCR